MFEPPRTHVHQVTRRAVLSTFRDLDRPPRQNRVIREPHRAHQRIRTMVALTQTSHENQSNVAYVLHLWHG